MDGFFVDIPVNLAVLYRLGVKCVKFGFQTPPWFHSYPYDQQMELRECYFLEEKEVISPRLSWLRIGVPHLLLHLFPDLLLNYILSFLLHSALFLYFFLCPLGFFINGF